MKGLFIPGITAEMFRNGCLESVEALMAEGKIYDIEYSKWIPVSEMLPEDKQSVLVWCPQYKNIYCAYHEKEQWWIFGAFVQIVQNEVIAWMPLPKPYEPQESEEQMTRKEAIKVLTSLVEVRRKYCDMQTMKDEIQCLEMAIQALKQEQTRDEKMIDAIDFAIRATDSQDDYSMGMRNGMRYVKSLINGKEPQYELRQTDEEIKLGIDIGDEVVNEWGAKGVVIGIDTSYEGEVLLSLLMRNHKVPQLVVASRYKTKTGRHFPQIIEVLEQIKGESDGK